MKQKFRAVKPVIRTFGVRPAGGTRRMRGSALCWKDLRGETNARWKNLVSPATFYRWYD